MKTVKDRWPTIVTGLIIVVGYLALAWSLLPKGAVGYADSDEFMVVAQTAGIPHPPGYPLLSLLVVLAGRLPLPFPLAAKVHLVSSLFHALTLLLVFLIGGRLLARVTDDARIRWGAALAGALALAASFDFLLHSLFIEVFALNTFLGMAIVYCLVRWADERERPSGDRWLPAAAFIFGFGLANQQTIILLAPMIVYWLFHHDRRWLFDWRRLVRLAAAGALGFLLPYLYVVIASRADPVYSWAGNGGVGDLVRLITRQEYGSPEGGASAYFNPNWSLGVAVQGVGPFMRYLTRNFTLLPLLISALGLVGLWREREPRRAFWLMVLALFGGGLFFALYAPVDWAAVRAGHPLVIPAQFERFFLLSLPVVGLLVSLGAGALLRSVQGWVRVVAIAVLIGAVGTAGVVHARSLVRNDWTAATRYGRAFLSSLPPNAIAVCRNDLPCFAGLYLQTVEGIRPDVIFVGLNFRQKTKTQINQLIPDAIRTTSEAPPDLFTDLVRYQIDRRPIFLIGFHPFVEQLAELHLAGNPFFVIPRGCAFEVARVFELKEPLAGCDESDQALTGESWAAKNQYQVIFRATLVEQQLLAAQLYALHACFEQAFAALARLDAVIPNDATIKQTRTALEAATAEETAEEAVCPDRSSPPTLAELERQAVEAETAGRLPEAAGFLRQATLIDPTRLDLRLRLARLYQRGGDRSRAMTELKDILVLDPNHQEAHQLLQTWSVSIGL